ncbi:ABC transporter permease, partial [Pseudomonas syringae pv. tagetis]
MTIYDSRHARLPRLVAPAHANHGKTAPAPHRRPPSSLSRALEAARPLLRPPAYQMAQAKLAIAKLAAQSPSL